MKYNARWLGLVLAALCLSSCNSTKEEPTSTAEQSMQVGDFNFVEQQTTAPAYAPQTTSEFVYQTDADGNQIPDITTVDIFDTPSTAPIDPFAEYDTTQPVLSLPVDENTVSQFMDLSTNYSIQIGANVYVSVPQNLLEKCIDLDSFVDNQRIAYNLVAAENRASVEVQQKVYAGGTCVHLDSQKMYIDGYGIGYWIKNFESSLQECKEPTIQFFNLGKIQGESASVTKNYSRLGTMLYESETDYYYKAVYPIKDLESNNAIDARAIVVFDKTTSSASTCVVYINKTYYTEGLLDTDFLASSCRFSVVTPDNIVTFN